MTTVMTTAARETQSVSGLFFFYHRYEIAKQFVARLGNPMYRNVLSQMWHLVDVDVCFQKNCSVREDNANDNAAHVSTASSCAQNHDLSISQAVPRRGRIAPPRHGSLYTYAHATHIKICLNITIALCSLSHLAKSMLSEQHKDKLKMDIYVGRR